MYLAQSIGEFEASHSSRCLGLSGSSSCSRGLRASNGGGLNVTIGTPKNALSRDNETWWLVVALRASSHEPPTTTHEPVSTTRSPRRVHLVAAPRVYTALVLSTPADMSFVRRRQTPNRR